MPRLQRQQGIEQTRRGHRLGQDGVDQFPRPVVGLVFQLLQTEGRHHDDRRQVGMCRAPNEFVGCDGGLQPVHSRHFPVEQKQFEGFPGGERGTQFLQRLFA